MALAWFFRRVDAKEAALAKLALKEVSVNGATVPGLWYPEVANGLLVGERRGLSDGHRTAVFQADLAHLEISAQNASINAVFSAVLSLARKYGLTGYDATYLELALRLGAVLATFDLKLAEAAQAAGVRVFGDAP
jgi:predicted nucleic acid-binding protein